MIEGRNIICIASNWFYDPTSKHHIMRLLAERNHVIWVNYHASRQPSASIADAGRAMATLRQFITGPRRVSENMTVLTPMVVPLPGNRAARALNRRLLVRQIRSVLRELPRRPVQLWSFAPDVEYLCDRFGEEAVIYYCVDEFSEFTGYDRDVTLAAEARLAARADLVVATSRTLLENKRSLNPRTVLVTHGVDAAHFNHAASPDLIVPQDVRHLPRPILGFWGLLQDWLDLDLLATLARSRPDWTIILIGEAATDTAPLTGLSNVRLLGRRPYASLPAYAKAFDVGLIPFRLNALTRAVNPIKLREYLAAGLPVVSSPLPEADAWRPWVQTALNEAAWIGAIEGALESRSPACDAARREAVRGETWEAKVKRVCELLQDTAGAARFGAGPSQDDLPITIAKAHH